MASRNLLKRIQELHGRDIYVGVQSGDAGFRVWMTDRHFKQRVDHLIKTGTTGAVADELHSWLDAQALKLNVIENDTDSTRGLSPLSGKPRRS